MKRFLGLAVWVLGITAVGSAQSTFYFPQVADGQQPGGIVWTTSIAITNPAPQGSAAVSGTISFNQDDGTAFNLAFNDEQGKPVGGGNAISFSVQGGQTRYYISTAAGNLLVGFAKIITTAPITATAVFSESQNGQVIAQAAVFSASPLAKQATFVIEDNFNDTAVAIANSGTTLANLSFQLLDVNGVTPVATPPATNVTLPAGNHTAKFVSQLFPNVPRPFFGTMQVNSNAPLVATSLLFGSGGKFSTFPIITLTSIFSSPLNSLARLWHTLRSELA